MSPVESLVKRLAEVQDLLSDLPNDAFAERSALLAERAELVARADRYADGADRERPVEDLRHELALLRAACARETEGSPQELRIVARIKRLDTILAERELAES